MHSREQLINDIAPMFYEKGFWGVKVDDIANDLKISKKTLYVFFANKKDIIKSVIEHRFQFIYQLSKESEQNSSNAVKALIHLVSGFYKLVDIEEDKRNFQELQRYYPDIYSMQTVGICEVIQNIIATNYVRGQKEGLYRTSFDAAFIGRAFAMSYLGNRLGLILTKKDIDLKQLRNDSLKLFFFGMVTENGLKILEEIWHD